VPDGTLGVTDTNPSTIEYLPPLARAVLSGDLGQVKLLANPENVEERVRAKVGARAGFTPLILAAAQSDADMVQMLIARGAKVTDVDDFHRSPLWYGALQENVALLKTLTAAPGSRDVVDTADDDLKRTPLHFAVQSNEPELVSLLLSIDPTDKASNQKDVLGETPTDFCLRRFTKACQRLTNALAQRQPGVTAGSLVFAESCRMCHEPKNGNAIGPILTKNVAGGDKGAVRHFIENGKGSGMPAFKYTLNPRNIDAVMNYLATVPDQPQAPRGGPKDKN
jgi:mono/diheme cytochrome c family protein